MQVSSTTTATPQGLGVEVQSAADLKTDFLKLLTTQLANQDPLSPMDNQAMVEQLATFSQLEQLEGVNNKLEQQMQYSQSLNNTMMMNLVGKRVTVLGDQVEIRGGQPSRSLIRTAEAGVGTARIVDADGKVVRTISGIPIQPGFNEIEWDGLGDDGRALPDGDYTIEVDAERFGGGFMSVALFQSGIVDTIQFDNNFQTLIVNGQRYTAADVVEVGLAPSTGGSGTGPSTPPVGSGDEDPPVVPPNDGPGTDGPGVPGNDREPDPAF